MYSSSTHMTSTTGVPLKVSAGSVVNKLSSKNLVYTGPTKENVTLSLRLDALMASGVRGLVLSSNEQTPLTNVHAMGPKTSPLNISLQ